MFYLGMIKMPLFGKSPKSPNEVVKSLKENLTTLEKGGDGKKQEKAQEEVGKQLVTITGMIYGGENEQQSDHLLAQLSQVGFSLFFFFGE